MIFYDIVPPEKLRKIVKEEILGIKVYNRKSKKYFALSWRIALLFFIVLYFVSGINPIKILEKTIRAISGEEKTINFYANSCSGEWQNLQNAQGEPDVLATANIDLFSEANSAFYGGGSLSIVCQNFQSINSESYPAESETTPIGEEATTTETTITTTTEMVTTTTEEVFKIPTSATTTPAILTPKEENPTSTSEATTSTSLKIPISEFSSVEMAGTTTEAISTATEPVSFKNSEKEIQQDKGQFQGAKIKFSFAIGEIEAPTTSLQFATTTQTENSTTFEESISFWNKIKNFFKIFSVKAQETPINFETNTATTTIFPETKQFTTETTTTETVMTTTTTEATITTTTILEVTTTTDVVATNSATIQETITPTVEATSSETSISSDVKIMIWYSFDGEFWVQLDEIKTFTSNALNGGYFEYETPFLKNWEDIKNLRIKLEGVIGGETNVVAFLDSVWVEVKYSEEEKEQEKIEFLSNKKDFRLNETPEFQFLYRKKSSSLLSLIGETFNLQDYWQNINITAQIVNTNGEIIEISPDFVLKNNGKFLVKLKKPRGFRPGLYKLILRIEEKGEVRELEQNFSWGVLAINTNKSIYLPNETAYLQIAVLDDEGSMVCNADLTLEIVSPQGEKTVLTTSEGKILVNPECWAHSRTTKPDYGVRYTVNGEGVYLITLTAVTQNGMRSITDNFEVRSSVPFDIERQGPTRILPTEPYTMKFIIKVNQDFAGVVRESVPQDFDILKTELFLINTGIKTGTTSLDFEEESKVEISIEPFQIINQEDEKTISWTVRWQKNQVYELSYQFDAPDISPYLYLLGPLKFVDFQEIRQWQIAADSPGPASTIGTTTDYGTQFALNELVHYANGYYWAVYHDGTTAQWRSSSDGVTWGSASDVFSSFSPSVASYGIRFYGNYILAAGAPIGNNQILNFRRGSLGTDGSITWDSADVQVDSVTSGVTFGTYVVLDSADYPWVFTSCRVDGGISQVRVNSYRNSLTTGQGTWTYYSAIAPYIAATNHTLIGAIALSNRDMFVVSGGGVNIEANKFTSSTNSWGTKYTIATNRDNDQTYKGFVGKIVKTTNYAHFIYLNDAFDATHYRAALTSGLDAVEDWTNVGTPVEEAARGFGATLAVNGGRLYLIYSRADDKIYYKAAPEDGSWGLENVIISDTTNKYCGPASYDDAIDNAIVFIWTEGAASPYNVKFEKKFLTPQSSNNEAVGKTFQRKTFYAAGRHWLFFSDGTNAVFHSSTDGSTWSDPTTLVPGIIYGSAFSIWYDGTYVHYAANKHEEANHPLVYRRGTPQSDGTISWSAAEQTVISASADYSYNGSMVTVNSGGYPWIGYMKYNRTLGEAYPYAIKSSTNDGTWTTDFDYQLSVNSNTNWRVALQALTSNKMYAFFGNPANTIKGKLYDGSWGDQETVTLSNANQGVRNCSSVAEGDTIHFVYQKGPISKELMYRKRNGSWSATEDTIQGSVVDYVVPALAISGSTLYCFWQEIPTGDHIYYKKRVSGTWDTDPTDWYNETTDGLPDNPYQACSYQAYGNKISFIYLTHTSAPYNVKFAILSVTALPTVNNVSLNNAFNIDLTEGTTHLVTSTATVSHPNGYTDITSVIGKIYRSEITGAANCSLNDNNCYQDSACATSSCSGTSCTATCSFNVWYHADPTVTGTPWNSEYWVAWIKAIDSQNASSSATNTTQTIEMNDLVALSLLEPTGNLDFGTLTPGQNTNKINVTSTVAATGNCALDSNMSGQGLVKSGGTTMIDIQNQKYSTTTAPYDSYSTGGATLTTTTVEFELELAKTTDHTTTSTKKIFWGLSVPIGKETGKYYGTTTVAAVKDELDWP